MSGDRLSKTARRHKKYPWRYSIDSLMNVPLCRRVLLHKSLPEGHLRQDSHKCSRFRNLQSAGSPLSDPVANRLILDGYVYRGVGNNSILI